MYGDKEFKTVVFGGYNKEEVHEYLQMLEKDSEFVKFGYQSELKELKTELEKYQNENKRQQGIISEFTKKIEEYERKKKVDYTETEFYVEELKKQKKENESLKQKIVKLEAEKQMFSEDNKHMEKELEKLNTVGISSEKNMQLEDEMKQLKEEKAKYEEEIQAIRKVLNDARLSAQYIQEEARIKAEEIVDNAQKETRDIIEHRKMQIDKELEDRGIRLMAAKYKIEAYRKEINDTQQKLYNLYSDMGQIVENMPQSLEQLWDEETVLKISEKEIILEEKAEIETKESISVKE